MLSVCFTEIRILRYFFSCGFERYGRIDYSRDLGACCHCLRGGEHVMSEKRGIGPQRRNLGLNRSVVLGSEMLNLTRVSLRVGCECNECWSRFVGCAVGG